MKNLKFFKMASFIAPLISLTFFWLDRFYLPLGLWFLGASFVSLFPVIIMVYGESELKQWKMSLMSLYYFIALVLCSIFFFIAGFKIYGLYATMVQSIILMYLIGKLGIYAKRLVGTYSEEIETLGSE